MVSEKIVAAIKKKVQANLTEQIELTRKLIQIPSVTGQEGAAQRFMAELYRSAGLDTRIVAVDFEMVRSHPAYCGFEESASAYSERFNVIGRCGGDGDGRSLMMNGHIDVVSSEPMDQWTYDPWAAKIVGGRIYGRGANDMKSGLIANFMALKCLLNLGLQPLGGLELQSVLEEEAGGGGGTLSLLLQGFTADGAIVTEPTNLGIRIGSGGVLYFRLTVPGRTAHAGNAHLGVNAISHLIPIYQALETLGDMRGNQRAPLFEKGSHGKSCHLNLGVLHAGDWPSTVPGKAVLEGRVGFLPTESARQVQDQIKDAIHAVVSRDEWLKRNKPALQWFGFKAEPWLEDVDSLLLKTVQDAVIRITGNPPDIHARASAVDNRFFPEFGCATLCVGTRGFGNHAVDEYVEIESLAPLTEILAVSVLSWCGYKE